MRVLKKILLGICILLGLLIVISFFLPSKVVISRETTINAPSFIVFEQVNSFKNWASWSPWQKKDSTVKNTYTGPESGAGAKMSWTSEQSGPGNMTIDTSQSPSRISLTLVFEDFNTKSRCIFEFADVAGATNVSWTMTMELGWNPLMKYFGLFMPGFIGPDFEEGLALLKARVENMPKFQAVDQRMGSTKFVSARETGKFSELGKIYQKLYPVVWAYAEKEKATTVFPPFARFHNPTESGCEIECCIPVNKELKGNDAVQYGTTPRGKAYSVTFTGPYSQLEKAHTYLKSYLKGKNLVLAAAPLEFYHISPATEPDSMKWKTEVVYPYLVD